MPNINTTHAVLWPSPYTHTLAAAGKITLTCPHFHLHSSVAKSKLFPKQKGYQKRCQGSMSPSTGSVDGAGVQWHSTMAGLCFGLTRNMYCRNEKKALRQKTQREKGRAGVKRILTGFDRQKSASMSALLHLSEAHLHARPMPLFGILS